MWRDDGLSDGVEYGRLRDTRRWVWHLDDGRLGSLGFLVAGLRIGHRWLDGHSGCSGDDIGRCRSRGDVLF